METSLCLSAALVQGRKDDAHPLFLTNLQDNKTESTSTLCFKDSTLQGQDASHNHLN